MRKTKIAKILVLSLFLGGLFLPQVITAGPIWQPLTKCTIDHDLTRLHSACVVGANITTNQGGAGICCVMDAVFTVSEWLFFAVLAVSILMMLIGAFIYLTSSGDPGKAKKGRTLIIFALIGVLIAVFVRFIPAIVLTLVGV